jgi:hypothetical protein
VSGHRHENPSQTIADLTGAKFPLRQRGVGAPRCVYSGQTGVNRLPSPKLQMTGALSRRSFRHSILFQVLAGAALWPRHGPMRPYTVRPNGLGAR